jgi:hypothetical protein
VPRFLSAEYSLSHACDDVSKLDVHVSQYHLLAFCEAVIKYVRVLARREHGVDILSVWEKKEVTEFARAIILKNPNLDNDMLFIVVAHALQHEVALYLRGTRQGPRGVG